jgi:hypothetical protein
MQDTQGSQGTPPAQGAMTRGDAGLGAMLDFGFNTFITLSVIKILYILGMALIALCWLIGVVMGFTQGALAGVGGLIVISIFAVIELIFLRVWLELICVIFRIGENTSKLVQAGGGA